MITAVTDDAVADTGSAAAMDEEPITAEFTATEAEESNG
jgi:hypothetical protein